MFPARGPLQGPDPKDDLRLGRLVEVEDSRSAEVQGSMHRSLLQHTFQFAALAYLKPAPPLHARLAGILMTRPQEEVWKVRPKRYSELPSRRISPFQQIHTPSTTSILYYSPTPSTPA